MMGEYADECIYDSESLRHEKRYRAAGRRPRRFHTFATGSVLRSLKLKLQMVGIEIESIQKAVGTRSIYVKFTDDRLRSLTVRDHPGIPKYRYKWNLFKGYKGETEVYDNGVKRFYYSFDQVDDLVRRMSQYKQTCEANGTPVVFTD